MSKQRMTKRQIKQRKRRIRRQRAAEFIRGLDSKGKILFFAEAVVSLIGVLMLLTILALVIIHGIRKATPSVEAKEPVIVAEATTEPAAPAKAAPEPAAKEAAAVEVDEPAVYIFRDGEGQPVDWQATTNEWAAEAGMVKRYELTDAERWEVASVVTAEAGGEPYAGMVAVAQCILQAAEDAGIRPDEALVKYKYAKSRPEPSEKALEAVADVFDFGNVVTVEPIKFFYAPARCQSDWHESQIHVLTINGHKFFKEAQINE